MLPGGEIAERRRVQACVEAVGGAGLGTDDLADDGHLAPGVCCEHRHGHPVVAEPCRNVLDHRLAGVLSSAAGDRDQLARQRDDGFNGWIEELTDGSGT